MTRYIDADALRSEMYMEAFEKDSDMQRWDSGCWIRYKLFENVLDAQPTVKAESHWIPCSERLPEENGTYLVYAPDYRGGSSGGKEWHDGIMFAKFKAGKWSIEHGYYSRPNCVIAWMPLPKPYEVEND